LVLLVLLLGLCGGEWLLGWGRGEGSGDDCSEGWEGSRVLRC
jgi:hypothetical protein